jgi:hypothetical protein
MNFSNHPFTSCSERSFSMVDDFPVHILWYLPGKAHSNADNFLRIESRQVTENLIRTAIALTLFSQQSSPTNVPRTRQDVRPYQHKLCHNTQKVQMRTICEQEIPKLQDLR